MSAEVFALYETDWFWLACVLGFFVQFAQPLPKRRAKPRPKPRMAKTRKAKPTRSEAQTQKPVKQKKRKPQKYTPAQQALIDRYFLERDYPAASRGRDGWTAGSVPL